jgi:hypothetical protein
MMCNSAQTHKAGLMPTKGNYVIAGQIQVIFTGANVCLSAGHLFAD